MERNKGGRGQRAMPGTPPPSRHVPCCSCSGPRGAECVIVQIHTTEQVLYSDLWYLLPRLLQREPILYVSHFFHVCFCCHRGLAGDAVEGGWSALVVSSVSALDPCVPR